MKKEKQAYVAPITESQELRFEGMVCTSKTYSTESTEFYNPIDGGDL